uniref:Uncharacterized protein LOC117360019 isoform X2 n=1 Tax=Geotrypetes seraphini TaxID=260995 RepID=A0A6P8QQP7_GEOSA|nr:uncharacterized protein LOC117360019 isoform X2 [Geotrypetes seraphini]
MAARSCTDPFMQRLDKNELLFRKRMEAICRKYDHPFEDDITINLADLTYDLHGGGKFCPSGNSSLFESSVKSGPVEKPMQVNETMKLENESTMVIEHETKDIPGDDLTDSSLVSNEESISDMANKTYTLIDTEFKDLWVSGISHRSSVGVSQVKPTGKENFHVTYSPLKKRNGGQGNRTDSSKKYLHNCLHDAPHSPSNAEMISKMRSFISRHKRSLEPHTYMSSDGRFHHSKDELYAMHDRTRNLCEVQMSDTFSKTSLETASDTLELNDVTLVDLYPGMIQSMSRLMEFACKKRAADDIVKHYKRSIWNVNKMKLNITKERLRDFHPVKSRQRKPYISPDGSKSKEISQGDCLNKSSRTLPEGQNLKQSWSDSGADYSITLNAMASGLEHSESRQINASLQPSQVKKDSSVACYRATNALEKRIGSWGSPQATAHFLSVRQNTSPKTTSVLMEKTYIVQSPHHTSKSWGLPERDRSRKQFESSPQQQSSVTHSIGSSSRPFILEKGNIQTCSPLKTLTEKNVNDKFGLTYSLVNLNSTFLSNLVEDYNSFKSVPLQRRHSCSAVPIKKSPVKTPLGTEDMFSELYRKLVLKQHISPLDKRRILNSRRLEAIHSSKIVDALVSSPLQKRVKRTADFYSDDDFSMSDLKRSRNVLEHFTSNSGHHQPFTETNANQYDLTSSLNITKNIDTYSWKFQRMMPEYPNRFHSNRKHELKIGVSSPPVITDTSSNKYVSPRRMHDFSVSVSRKLSYTGKRNPGSASYLDGFQV